MRIAIVGAGMAGLAAGTRLVAAGHNVSLFDKGRGAGGRMATRRVTTTLGDVFFDHGAQYFTVRTAEFASCVDAWRQQGLVAPWPAAGDAAFVGTPSMNTPLRAMAGALDAVWNIRVEAVEPLDGSWIVRGEGIAPRCFDTLIIAVPAEQAVALLAPVDRRLADCAAAAISAPCWTVMAAFDASVNAANDVLGEPREPIGWAARNSAKPGRTGPEAWVVQASPAWSTSHLEDDPATVIDTMLAALGEAVGGALPRTLSATAHRWRYARSTSAGIDFLWDGNRRIGVCGDWLREPRIESAWLSGYRLANTIIG
jgi:renalase